MVRRRLGMHRCVKRSDLRRLDAEYLGHISAKSGSFYAVLRVSCMTELDNASEKTAIVSNVNELCQETSATSVLGCIVKGGRKQFQSEMAVASANDYVVLDGLQYVLPYSYDCRIRYRSPWEGRTLMDVLCNEFPSAGPEYWAEEIASGRLVSRSGLVKGDEVWSVGMSVWHTKHTHESPVSCEEVQQIHVCDRFVVVSKPSSMPVHPCGRFRRNSLIFILAARYGFRKLFVVHRLDKATSGVVIFARSTEVAAAMHEKMRAHELRKTYLAEVAGHFEKNEFDCWEPLTFNLRTLKSKVDPNGKAARTQFTKLYYRPATDTTLLEIRPFTGRQHQIRAHLEHLKHPIVGDHIYGNGSSPCRPRCVPTLDDTRISNGHEILDIGRKLGCKDCPELPPSTFAAAAKPIRLYALRYEGAGYSFEAKPPSWALSMRPN